MSERFADLKIWEMNQRGDGTDVLMEGREERRDVEDVGKELRETTEDKEVLDGECGE